MNNWFFNSIAKPKIQQVIIKEKEGEKSFFSLIQVKKMFHVEFIEWDFSFHLCHFKKSSRLGENWYHLPNQQVRYLPFPGNADSWLCDFLYLGMWMPRHWPARIFSPLVWKELESTWFVKGEHCYLGRVGTCLLRRRGEAVCLRWHTPRGFKPRFYQGLDPPVQVSCTITASFDILFE